MSQLKLCPNPTEVVHQPLIAAATLQKGVPEAILDRKMVKRGRMAATKVLVKWKDLPVENATWEYYYDLLQQFPEFHP